MDNILHRISQISELEDISIGKIEQKIGASKGVLYKAIQKNSDIQSKWVVLIAENFPQYNPEWILTGKGEMQKDSTKSRLSQNITGNSNIQSGNNTSITGDSSQQVKELQKQLKERDKEIERLKTQVDKLFKMIP
jgi:hypothetical protein